MIGARDWIERSAVDGAIWERWPDYRVWLVGVDDVDASGLAETADQLFEQVLRSAQDSSEVDGHVLRWRVAYADFGVKQRTARSSVDALLRRSASEKAVPRINVLVDLYNAVSMLHRVPIGGEDLDDYDGPARLVFASGTEPFETTRAGEPTIELPEPGEPIWVDDTGITCRRWNWRQTSRTAIGPSCRRVGFIIDSLDAPHHAGAQRAAAQLAALFPDAVFRSISSMGDEPC